MATKTQVGLDIPSESVEQQCLFRWAAYQSGKYPELCMLYHIPNGGKRSKSEAIRFRAEGVKPGVPDICFPVARCGYHGLYIELKRRKGGVVSYEQMGWIRGLEREGYCARVCRGWEEAMQVLMAYMDGKREELGDGSEALPCR